MAIGEEKEGVGDSVPSPQGVSGSVGDVIPTEGVGGEGVVVGVAQEGSLAWLEESNIAAFPRSIVSAPPKQLVNDYSTRKAISTNRVGFIRYQQPFLSRNQKIEIRIDLLLHRVKET